MLNFIRITQIFGTYNKVPQISQKLQNNIILDCTTSSSSFLLLSLDAHNHVDDYSGTFGDVRKTKVLKNKKKLVVR